MVSTRLPDPASWLPAQSSSRGGEFTQPKTQLNTVPVSCLQVRSFFAQSNQTVSGGKKRKRNHQRNRGENFSAELMDFKRFSNDVKEKEKR